MSTSAGPAKSPDNHPDSNHSGHTGSGADSRRANRDHGDALHQDNDGDTDHGLKHDVAREKEEFGGIKIGSAFFGWLTATGTAILLSALAAALGAAVGSATNTDIAGEATADPQTASIISSIVLLAILLIAYYCGGYVAGRMARFNGVKQGIAVWVWAIVIAIIVAILGLIAGDQFNILSQINSFPQIPAGDDLTTSGIIAALIAAAVALLGAILGGLAGMRFHRKVDKAGLRT
jgi:amino acid transporter